MQEWIIPVISVVGSVFGSYLGVRIAVAKLEVQVAHIDGLIRSHDATIDSILARLGPVEADLERMKADIGTHDTGLRGQVHDQATMLTAHEQRLHLMDKVPMRELK